MNQTTGEATSKCRKCNREKPLDQFNRFKNGRLYRNCNRCNAFRAKYRGADYQIDEIEPLPYVRPTHKRCGVCEEIKGLAEFHRSNAVRDGRQQRCRACESVIRRQRLENFELTQRMRNARESARAALEAVGEKECQQCETLKPLSDFQRRSSTLDGFHGSCRACRKTEKAMNYLKNPEKYRAINRAKYALNAERYRVAIKRWQAKHPERRREYEHRRRAQIAGTRVGPINLDALSRASCGICGHRLDWSLKYPNPMSRSLDHITPLVLGGSHEQSNVQWTHLRCNIRKGARLTA